MSADRQTPKNELLLRQHAEDRLKHGTAPFNGGWTTGADALAILHQLASDPGSASKALKFLHELQVYQVELDLQHEQLEQSRQDIADELDRYVELFDRVPVGLLTVDNEGTIIESNPCAASLLDVNREQLSGQRVDSLLEPTCRQSFHDLLRNVRENAVRETCVAQRAKGGEAARPLRLTASRLRDGRSIIVAITESFE